MPTTPNSQFPTPKRSSGTTGERPFDIRERTFLFSYEVLQWVRTVPNDWPTQAVARQLLRAATSVGANVEEADGADTPKDKIYKWALSRKEAREARYWVRLLRKDGHHSVASQAICEECTELVNILSAMIKKGKRDL